MQRETPSSSDFVKNALKSYDFTGGVRASVEKLMMQAVVPWIDNCFEKYDEYTFHTSMAQGFSFVRDWKENHSGGPGRDKKYLRFMYVARRMYDMFGITLNEEYILGQVTQLLDSRGWVLYEEEVSRMREDLLEIKAEIEN